MDFDFISRLKTPDGALTLLPYPTPTVDMGQFLARMKSPSEIETLWLDYVLELAMAPRHPSTLDKMMHRRRLYRLSPKNCPWARFPLLGVVG